MKLQGKSGIAEKNRRKYFSQSIYCNESIMNIENYGKALSATVKISCKDLHKECREAYKKSGRKDWNTFQKEYYKENR